MRTGIIVEVTAADRARLEVVVADRNSPQKHGWRARIVLLTADGCGTAEIMRRTGRAKTAVWRWQERFMLGRVDGLLRDKTRPSRIPALGPEVAERVVAMTLADPPGETTHWTADATAEASGISASSVRRIWRSHGLQPHRFRRFKLSKVRRGTMQSRTLLLDTNAHAVTGSGTLDLGREQLDFRLRTEPKRPTIASLPAPIHIGGTLKNPAIRPELGEAAARAGAAVGLGVLFPPLALLPTIQLGVGENSQCEALQAAGERRRQGAPAEGGGRR